MGRNLGTNNYSNSFEPQVKGYLDAREKVEGPASDLILDSTWTSSDGNVWAHKGMTTAVVNDPDASKNGLYMLMADDYTVASNWMKIGESGGSSVQNRVAVINTNSLLDPNRTEIIPLCVTDINTLKGLRADEILVYNGVSTLNKVEIIPVGFTFMGDDFVDLKLSYVLDGRSYYIDISVSGSGNMTADAPMPYSPDNIEEILLPISLTTDDSKEHTNLDFANKIREIASADNRNKVYYLYTSTQRWIINILSQIGNYAGIYFNNVNVVYSITTTKSAGDSKITVSRYTRQETLVSGINIKTVNGQSLLGFGNLTIGGNDAIYLTTTGLLDNFEDTSLDSSDVEVLRDLYSDSITRIPNVIYTGLAIDTTTRYYVPLNIAFDTSVPDGIIYAMFIHPETGDTMVIAFDLQNSLASMPQPASVGSSGSSSNIKILTTPNLMNISRTTSLKLNPADTLTITTFTKDDILISNAVPSSSVSSFIMNIPISIQKGGNNNIGIVLLDWVVAKKNYNMILNISNGTVTAQPPVESSNSSGGSGEAAYVTTLNLQNTITGDLLSQAEYDEIINIHNKWKQGIPVIATVGSYRGILNINRPTTTITNNSTISFSIIYNSTIETWSTQMTVDSSQWTREYPEIPLAIDLYDIYELGTFTAEVNTTLHDAFKKLDEYYSAGRLIYANAFWSYYGNFNIDRDDEEMAIYVNYQNRKYKIKYDSQADGSYTYTVTDVTPYNLNLEVRVSDNHVQCRINEVIPNGYICLYRKKKCYNTRSNIVKKNKYTIPNFYFPKRPTYTEVEGLGTTVLDASTFTPNEWKTIAIPSDLITSKGVNLDRIKFKGNTHANPCIKTTTGGVDKQTAVLHMGLAYNIMNPNFMNGTLENGTRPNDIVRHGNMVKFKARLNCDLIFDNPYEIIFTME